MHGNKTLTTLYRYLALLLCIAGISGVARAQCTYPVRRYATSQQVNAGALTSVTNPTNAADGNITTYSVINRPLGVGSLITVTQFLSFSSQIISGTPVTVKVNIPASLVALLGGVTIQPFTGLKNDISTGFTWQATAAGSATTLSSLVGVANGAGDMELTITPTANYDGVWVTMSGVAIGQSMNLYDAYVMQATPAVADCGTALDVLSGVRAGGVSLVNATGSVTNPTNAIDNSLSTYATLNLGAQVLSEVYLTAIFNTPSQPGDVVRMILQNNSGSGVINLGALSNFTIQLYNGSTAVGAPILSNSTNLSLTLLPGTTGNEEYQLDIKSLPTGTAFDRVDIQLGGVAAVGTALRIYDIKRLPATPVTTIGGTVAASQTICQGSTATLAINNAQPNCTTYSWYSTATGGTAITTGTSYTPPAGSLSTTAANTYYVQASRTGCTEVSDRIPVTINVNPAPTITNSAIPRTCKGTTTASMPYTSSNAPTSYSIVWDPPAITAGFVNITDAVLPPGAITVAVPAGAAAGTYTGIITVKNGTTTCSSTGLPFSVIVDTKPTQPVVNVTL
ncbi:immunoglobulin domain-containing protein [Mucilaginibacter polytrichastri]|uniref:Ig-like domain-containing protein n=1 Tax=Mucilaginibacter polytrichastri TaxID=1302689 RepID=A0A1Q6A397_9SPHI|nr:hypothetical protein [Mucilaginibacter polytrichastri]OKS88452.1 hypothetical protein RG47T_3919 [Mucilaginibacter polytrichastri]SFT12483.1 hypothetical protein SAMN04487890_111173 [Mucilaginibacter polytrichastri]